MMECYQAFADYHDIMRLVEQMMREIAVAVTGAPVVTYQGQQIDFGPAWARVPMAEAIAERTGIDIAALTEVGQLHAAIAAAGLKVERKSTWGKQVDELFSEFVEPLLIQPTFITDYPVVISPLAKRKPDQPAFTERFEIFVAGMELGNAFSELNDPFDQEQRFLDQLKDFDAGDADAHQMDRDYINALMYGMPPTGGLGIGIDRTVMLLTDQPSIREVILFPHLRQRE
jgi:lysyl-tRNA synthetase class 2